MIGNHTRAEDFAEILRPFWDDLLRADVGGPNRWERISVFYEPEDSERVIALEIHLEGDGWWNFANCRLIIAKHKYLSFVWLVDPATSHTNWMGGIFVLEMLVLASPRSTTRYHSRFTMMVQRSGAPAVKHPVSRVTIMKGREYGSRCASSRRL
jgi:hypothetical protein